ncbi:hypothetical protein BFJ69_g15414 [Fusarium oxysporum]|uniref:ATP-dependent DNA helicase n=1 Tax=Fusarium oxysporum TaxID=5507 RepID=A0A420MEC7_FUSOX|nr:hypothetical protein BFJ69_g15414 [Fusarium oxysporum]
MSTASIETGLYHRRGRSNAPSLTWLIQDEIKLWRSKGSIGKLHNIIHWVQRSCQRIEKLQLIENTALNLEDKTTYNVVTDNAARWNSSEAMMERGYELRNALDSLVQAEVTEWNNYVARRTQNGTKPMPKKSRTKPAIVDDKMSVEDWSVITEYLAILKPLKIATKRLEGRPKEDEEPHLRIGCNLGWMKLDRYYTLTEDSPVYLAALILHPAFRWSTVESQWGDHPHWLVRGKAAVQELWEEYRNLPVEQETIPEQPTVPRKTTDLDDFTASIRKLSTRPAPLPSATRDDTERDGSQNAAVYRPDGIGTAARLIDVLRNAITRTVITAASKEISAIVEQMFQFQETALTSEEDLNTAIILNDDLSPLRGTVSSTGTPGQEQLRAIKSQQISLSPIDRATARGGSEGLEQQNGQAATADWMEDTGPSTSIMFPVHIVFLLADLRQLDQVRRDEHCTSQLCLFIEGEGGTGKSRVITAIAELFARKSQSHRLLVTATSGTAAANINGITIHSACKFSKDTSTRTRRAGEPDGFAPSSSAGLRIDGQAKMDWQEKYALIIDEVSVLGARTLYAVNEQLRRLRESSEDFGDIPVIIFCADFHQFRPVQERSILLPSSSFPWGQGHGFGPEQQRQHDVAHALWRKFTVVMLKEQVRAAQDPRLRRLLTRVRQGAPDQSDVEFLNSNC